MTIQGVRLNSLGPSKFDDPTIPRISMSGGWSAVSKRELLILIMNRLCESQADGEYEQMTGAADFHAQNCVT